MSTSQPVEAAAFWDARYDHQSQMWSGRPNAVLVDEVADLPPGTALDLGCGEGADAVWLARRGWRVTAVDVSRRAIDRGVLLAEAEGVAERIDWQEHDLAATFPAGEFDLVSAQFLQSPIDFPRDRILHTAAAAVAPGGTLLIVGHASPPPGSDSGSGPGHQHPAHAFPDPADTAQAIGLDDERTWVLTTCEVRPRSVTAPDGETAHLSDSIIKASRRPGPFLAETP